VDHSEPSAVKPAEESTVAHVTGPVGSLPRKLNGPFAAHHAAHLRKVQATRIR
jgi:hypothetical protein